MKTITIDGVEYNLLPKVKFKVGDWIVKKGGETFYGGNYTEQITLIENDGYLKVIWLSSGTWVRDNDIRLWTIQDAKDGDVLVNGGFIFIFKNIDAGNGVHYYCAYEIRSHEEYEQFHIACFDSLMGRVGNSYMRYTPATKEQSDLLLSKMKEEGYQWDADKKELRKIHPHYDIANFKPKQWVLVRDCDNQVWGLSMFSHRDMGCYVCINRVDFRQCIPFDGNEKLLGTTDMPSEEYINW